jgi:hypothetical protein
MYGSVGDVDERSNFASEKAPIAGRTGPPVRSPLSADQQPATKADLYAAVDALRGEMHQLLDQISTLIKEASPAGGSRPTGHDQAGEDW